MFIKKTWVAIRKTHCHRDNLMTDIFCMSVSGNACNDLSIKKWAGIRTCKSMICLIKDFKQNSIYVLRYRSYTYI